MRTSSRSHWSDEEHEMFIRLAKEGHGSKDIGRIIGRSEEAVRSRATKLGVSLRAVRKKGK
jgi:DNA-directed RNA polymerase specialized sigma24 family protein